MVAQFIEWLTGIGGGGTLALVAILIVLFICGVGLPLPEEAPIIAAAYLSYLGVVNPYLCFVLLMLAVLAGDSIIYYAGHRFGHRIFEIPIFKRMLTPWRVRRVNEYFHKYGNRVIFFGRFIAGVRGTLFLTAGILRMRYRRFILYDAIAAAIGISVNLWVVHFFGPEIDLAIATLKKTGRTFLVIGLLALLFTVFFIVRRIRLAKEESATEKLLGLNEHSTSPKPPASAEGPP